jgi:hypothetical protein
MLEVFGDHDPTLYADEAQERWGDSDAWAQSQRRAASYDKQDWLRIRAEGEQVVAALAAAKAAGLPPTSPAATAAARSHGEHISRWFYDLTEEVHLGLGDMYVADDRFRRNYDDVAPGLAEYLRDAIRALYSSSSE